MYWCCQLSECTPFIAFRKLKASLLSHNIVVFSNRRINVCWRVRSTIVLLTSLLFEATSLSKWRADFSCSEMQIWTKYIYFLYITLFGACKSQIGYWITILKWSTLHDRDYFYRWQCDRETQQLHSCGGTPTYGGFKKICKSFLDFCKNQKCNKEKVFRIQIVLNTHWSLPSLLHQQLLDNAIWDHSFSSGNMIVGNEKKILTKGNFLNSIFQINFPSPLLAIIQFTPCRTFGHIYLFVSKRKTKVPNKRLPIYYRWQNPCSRDTLLQL